MYWKIIYKNVYVRCIFSQITYVKGWYHQFFLVAISFWVSVIVSLLLFLFLIRFRIKRWLAAAFGWFWRDTHSRSLAPHAPQISRSSNTQSKNVNTTRPKYKFTTRKVWTSNLMKNRFWYEYKFTIFTKKVQFYFELHFGNNGCWVKHKFWFYTVLAWRQSTALALFKFDSCRSCVQNFNKLFLSSGENALFKGEQLRSCVIRQ